jgi:Lysine methyltransferase
MFLIFFYFSSQLTPIDMINLSDGDHDATGHCVWLGAVMFIAAIPLLRKYGYVGNQECISSFDHPHRIIELGCGTGIASMALLLSVPPNNESVDSPDAIMDEAASGISARIRSSMFACFTDADPDSLEVCRRNCVLNELPTSSYQVVPLSWGEADLPPAIEAGSFGTVIATDVLYDIGLLSPLLATARQCLWSEANTSTRQTGAFILSHIPRACFNSENPPVACLEDYIIQRAACDGFILDRLIRPAEINPDDIPVNKDLVHWQLADLIEVGGAILVFCLQL